MGGPTKKLYYLLPMALIHVLALIRNSLGVKHAMININRCPRNSGLSLIGDKHVNIIKSSDNNTPLLMLR